MKLFICFISVLWSFRIFKKCVIIIIVELNVVCLNRKKSVKIVFIKMYFGKLFVIIIVRDKFMIRLNGKVIKSNYVNGILVRMYWFFVNSNNSGWSSMYWLKMIWSILFKFILCYIILNLKV